MPIPQKYARGAASAAALRGAQQRHRGQGVPPLAAVSGALALVGTFLVRDEESALPTIGPALVLIGVAMSAIDQLASLQAYAYTPFATRASASAFVALLSVAGSAVLLLSGRGSPTKVGVPLRTPLNCVSGGPTFRPSEVS